MKTLEEIKDEYAREIGFDDWNEIIYSHESDEIENHWIIVSKRYAIEVAKEALKNASKYAYLKVTEDNTVSINKESILSETNIPKL